MRAMILAAAALAAAAAPALAGGNPNQADYLDVSTTRTLEAQRTVAQYGFDAGSEGGGATNEVALNYGVTEDLMALGQFSLGGRTGVVTGLEGWSLGMAYAPTFAWGGLSPGAQLHYDGGVDPAVRGRAILAWDMVTRALFDGLDGRVNLAGNLLVEQKLQGDVQGPGLGYAFGATYPLFGSDAQVRLGDPRSVQRDAQAKLALGVEANGKLEPGEPHYLTPAVYAQPSERLEVNAGLGLKVAGEGPLAVPKVQLQTTF